MSTVMQLRPITVEEYLESEKYSDVKHEFVGGEVYAMIGASRAHNLIANAFNLALTTHLRGTACQVFISDVKLNIGNDFYYPDVIVTCDPADADPYLVTRPSLIVEVLSPTSVYRDTRDKLVAYRAIDTLREYVLAEQDRREVRVYRRTDSTWDLATYAPEAQIHLASVDLTLSLNEIYRDVSP